MRIRRSILILSALLAGSLGSTGCQGVRDRIASWSPRESAKELVRKPHVTESIESAITLEREGKLPEARELYLTELKTDPENPVVLHRLGVVSALLGEAQESREYFAKALKIEPHNVEVLTDLGFALNLQGDPEGAEKSLRLALSRDPEHERATKNLGRVLAFQDRYPEAAKEYRKVYNAAETEYRLAMIHVERGQIEEARTRLTAAKDKTWNQKMKVQVDEQLAKLDSMPAKPAVQLAKNTETGSPSQVTTAEETTLLKDKASTPAVTKPETPLSKPFPLAEEKPKLSPEPPLVAKEQPKSPAVGVNPFAILEQEKQEQSKTSTEKPHATELAPQSVPTPMVAAAPKLSADPPFQPPIVREQEVAPSSPQEDEVNPFAMLAQEKGNQEIGVPSTGANSFEEPAPTEFQQPISVAQQQTPQPLSVAKSPEPEKQNLVAPGYPDESLFTQPKVVTVEPKLQPQPEVPAEPKPQQIAEVQQMTLPQESEIPQEYRMPIDPVKPQAPAQMPVAQRPIEETPVVHKKPQERVELTIIPGTDPFLEAMKQTPQLPPRAVIQTVSQQTDLTEPAFDPRLPVLLPQPVEFVEQKPAANPGVDLTALFPIPDYNWKPLEEYANKVPAAAGWKGYCPVALQQQRQLARAVPEIHTVYRGKTYYFASAEAKKAFLAEPGKYIAVENGTDVVLRQLEEKKVAGSVIHARWYRGQLYFFNSEETMKEFVSHPERYAESTNY